MHQIHELFGGRIAFAAAVSGGPTHTGRSPARADPADGPAASRAALACSGAGVITAVADVAAGQDAGGARYGCIAGTFTVRPRTT